jgi:hypothetical protein
MINARAREEHVGKVIAHRADADLIQRVVFSEQGDDIEHFRALPFRVIQPDKMPYIIASRLPDANPHAKPSAAIRIMALHADRTCHAEWACPDRPAEILKISGGLTG